MLASRGLSAFQEASELEVIQVDNNGREHSLIPVAAKAWRKMKESAEQSGIELVVISAFRSISRQAEIIRRKLDSGMCINDILKVSAAPGYSEHHTGRAIDIGTPSGPHLEVEFELTEAFAWLTNNASRFGFYLSYPANNSEGYDYEPWHWCFKAPDNAFNVGAPSRLST